MIELLLTWENLYFLGLWFAAGILLTWNRKVGVSVAVPAIVAALPVVFGINAEGTGLKLFPFGSDPLPYIEGILLPVTASVLGGHVAIAVNPSVQEGRRTRVLLDQVTRRARRVEMEITQIESEAKGARSRTGAPAGEDQPEDVQNRIGLLRQQIADRRRQLRDLQRESR